MVGMDHGVVFEGKHWLSIGEEEEFDRDVMSEESNGLVAPENTSVVKQQGCVDCKYSADILVSAYYDGNGDLVN